MYEKKRARPFGRDQKLTPAERDDVAERYLAGRDAADLAQEFGISRSYVTSVETNVDATPIALETERTRKVQANG